MWVVGVADDGVELVGAWGDRAPDRAAVSSADPGRLTQIAREALHTIDASDPALNSLCPDASPGVPTVCGGLARDGAPGGVVVWRLRNTTTLDETTARVLTAALEPLAVALDTSHRFHELEAHRRAAEAQSAAALRRLGRESLDADIIGARRGLRVVLERVDLVAPSDVPTLILGETGSGKEVIARAIHDRSRRRAGPFIRVNCGAIPPELLDSHLFGHERGAFTGATERRQGWFERADGGTLFLDEIAELPPAAQVRLLRVIQDGALERVGGQRTVHVDCRVVAATHRDLPSMVRDGSFRADLWYRLAVFPIVLPPLRERRDDLRDLAEHSARRAAMRFGLPALAVDDDDLQTLAQYDWPGNVRELAAVIDRAALLGVDGRLAIDAAMGAPPPPHVAQHGQPSADARTPLATLDEAVRAHIREALARSAGKVEGPAGAAEALGLNPNTLRSKMRKLGVQSPRRR